MKKTLLIVVIILFIISLIYISTPRKDVPVVVLPPQPLNQESVKEIQGSNTLSTKYISNLDTWPPLLVVNPGTYACQKGEGETTSQDLTIEKRIDGRMYCITIVSGGAAGSTYSNYTYITRIGTNIAKSSFVIRYPQCMNYDEPKQSECKKEQASFSPDQTVSMVVENYIKTLPPEVTASKGYVKGHITIGPFCGAIREGQDECPVPPEAYSSRKVVVYEANGTIVREKFSIDSKGDYQISLNEGNYWLQVQPAGIGPGEKKKVSIVASKTSIVNFDIDTGIR